MPTSCYPQSQSRPIKRAHTSRRWQVIVSLSNRIKQRFQRRCSAVSAKSILSVTTEEAPQSLPVLQQCTAIPLFKEDRSGLWCKQGRAKHWQRCANFSKLTTRDVAFSRRLTSAMSCWFAVRGRRLTEGNVHKFGQNEELRKFLLSTGDAVLVEAAPRDQIWGIGSTQDNPKAHDPRQWRGQNLLGFAPMDVREKLRVSV